MRRALRAGGVRRARDQPTRLVEETLDRRRQPLADADPQAEAFRNRVPGRFVVDHLVAASAQGLTRVHRARLPVVAIERATGRHRAIAAAAPGDVVPVGAAVAARALPARTLGLRAAGCAAARSPHTARSSPVTRLPGIDDGVAAARKAAVRAAVVGRVPVRRPLVALLVRIDEAVPALDTARDAGLRCRAVVRGPAAERQAE